MIAIFSYKFLV